MKPSDVKVGETYVNRGAGHTRRKVLAISDKHRPEKWLSWMDDTRPDEPGVLFEQNGKRAALYLSSFAKWAKGPVVECDHPWHNNPALITDCPGCGAKA